MTPEKKKKIRKIIIITSISVISFYILGGVVASFIVNDVVFKDKVTNNGVLQSSVAFYKTQKDYPLLSERQEHTFKSGKNKLSGYYYDVSEDKGLVIFAHGLSNYSDDCNAQMHNYFVELGYDVFAIDLTGSGRSAGRTTIGLHQSAYDIKSAYNYLKDNNLLKDNLILCGHSWGAYGSVIASSIGVKTDKVIAFSAYNCPIDMMHEIAKQQVGFLADLNYPTYALGNLFEFGGKPFKKATDAIKKSDTNYLIIQGREDYVLTENTSLYKKVKDYDNVTPLLLESVGHSYPWLSTSSISYLNDLEKYYQPGMEIDIERSSKISTIVDSAIKDFLK